MSLIVKQYLSKMAKWTEDQNLKFPNRHKEIHKDCCQHCPSDRNAKDGTVDPESAEIKNYPKELIVSEFLFVCAWRGNKLCKGNCDYHGIDEQFIANCNLTGND